MVIVWNIKHLPNMGYLLDLPNGLIKKGIIEKEYPDQDDDGNRANNNNNYGNINNDVDDDDEKYDHTDNTDNENYISVARPTRFSFFHKLVSAFSLCLHRIWVIFKGINLSHDIEGN